MTINKLKGNVIDESLKPYNDYYVLSSQLNPSQVKALQKYFSLESYKPNVDRNSKGMLLIDYKETAWLVSENRDELLQVRDYLAESNRLLEYKRSTIMINAKDTPRRIMRAKKIHDIIPSDLDIKTFLSTGNLVLKYLVKRKYTDYVVLKGAKQYIADRMKRTNKTPDNIIYQDMLNYLASCIKDNDFYVSCSCPDFIYRFNYQSSKKGYGYGKPETRPAKITNPHDRGSVCKHLYAVLDNNYWIYKMIPQIIRCIKANPDEFGFGADQTANDNTSSSSTSNNSSEPASNASSSNANGNTNSSSNNDIEGNNDSSDSDDNSSDNNSGSWF